MLEFGSILLKRSKSIEVFSMSRLNTGDVNWSIYLRSTHFYRRLNILPRLLQSH